MKVKAIDVIGARNITLNKIYNVVEEKETVYVITKDDGNTGGFKKSRFTVVNEADLVVKVGNVYENEGEHFLLVTHDILNVKFAALVSVKTGLPFAVLTAINDINNITAEEFNNITAGEGADFHKVTT